MDNLTGKHIFISGMSIEVIADDGERWECRNITTGETVFIEKTVLENAIKLAKAEIIPEPDNK